LIKKRKEKKESSWVKLKAFPTNVWQPNNYHILTYSMYGYSHRLQ